MSGRTQDSETGLTAHEIGACGWGRRPARLPQRRDSRPDRLPQRGDPHGREFRETEMGSSGNYPNVRKGGVEPPRPSGHTDLNRARLPFRHSRPTSEKASRMRVASVAGRVPTDDSPHPCCRRDDSGRTGQFLEVDVRVANDLDGEPGRHRREYPNPALVADRDLQRQGLRALGKRHLRP